MSRKHIKNSSSPGKLLTSVDLRDFLHSSGGKLLLQSIRVVLLPCGELEKRRFKLLQRWGHMFEGPFRSENDLFLGIQAFGPEALKSSETFGVDFGIKELRTRNARRRVWYENALLSPACQFQGHSFPLTGRASENPESRW